MFRMKSPTITDFLFFDIDKERVQDFYVQVSTRALIGNYRSTEFRVNIMVTLSILCKFSSSELVHESTLSSNLQDSESEVEGKNLDII